MRSSVYRMQRSPWHCRRPCATPPSLGSRVGFRHEIQRRSARDELFSFFAFLELPDNAVRMLHHPPAHVALVDRLSFFRILHKVRNAGEAQWEFRIVEVLLAFEVDLEVFPFHGVQLFVQPYHAGVPIRALLLAEKEWTLVDTVDDPVVRW